MKQKFLKFPARPVRYAPRMQSRRLRLGLEHYNAAYKSEGGTATEEEPEAKTEAEAIAAISKQVEGFQKILGDKANKEEFENLKKQLADLQTNIQSAPPESPLMLSASSPSSTLTRKTSSGTDIVRISK